MSKLKKESYYIYNGVKYPIGDGFDLEGAVRYSSQSVKNRFKGERELNDIYYAKRRG